MIDTRDEPGGFRDFDEIVGCQNQIILATQPCYRFVEADLALRQGHHRLQVNVQSIFPNCGFHRVEDLHLAAGRGGFLGGDGSRRGGNRRRRRCRAGALRGQRRLFRRLARRSVCRCGGRHARRQHVLMACDGDRKLLDQHAEFADFADHRLNAVGARGIGRCQAALDRGKTAAEFCDLTCKIGRAA